jgi:Domain of unknown function (DUF6268)
VELTVETPKDFTNVPLDSRFVRVISRQFRGFASQEIHSSFSIRVQAHRVTKSQVILAVLILTGAGTFPPDWVHAQHSKKKSVRKLPAEVAFPADADESQPYQFFPRAAAVDESADVFSEIEQVNAGESSESDSESETDLNSESWDAAEQFSPRRFRDTIPTQYPLDDSVYEGEDPLGNNPQDTQGEWLDSSVHRPEETLSIEDQPWVEWHKFTLTAQTLPTGDKGLGITSLDLKGTLKFAKWPFLFVSPRIGLHSLDGPKTTDLPPQLYDFSLDTTFYLPLNDRWTVVASATPSMFSDLQATKDSLRLAGRGIVLYRWSPQLQFTGGVLYLGRKDISALPVAGYIYTPNEDVKFDIMYPKPKAAYRYHHEDDRERWVYVSGELGGGSWAVRRASGADDVASYRDLQLLVGIEHKQPEALNWQLEAGCVFSRELRYLSTPGVETTLPSTVVLRAILSY